MTGTTVRLSRDKRKFALIAAGVTALALLAWLAVGQTVAGFTATTENEDNTFAAGSVTITDDDGGSALFTYSDLLPGHEHTETITVSNGSTAPLKVKLFSSDIEETPASPPSATGTTNIAENLDVTVKILDGGTNPVVFQGTLAAFDLVTDWATGASAVAGGDAVAKTGETGSSLVYEITVKLKDTAGNESEDVWPGDSVTVTFNWEGRA